MKNQPRTLLRAVRAAKQPKVTQSHVARKAGMSVSRYWQIENGEGSEASNDEKNAVAAALGVKASEIAWPEIPKWGRAAQAS